MLFALIISLWAGVTVVLCMALFGLAAKPVPGFTRDGNTGEEIGLMNSAHRGHSENLVLAAQ